MKAKHVLFPTDFSPSAEAAFPHALFYAKQLGAELHLLHIVLIGVDDGFPSYSDSEVILARVEEEAREKLTEIRKQNPDMNISMETARGLSVATTVEDYVEQKGIDLVVMGTHGRKGFEHFLLGSVTEKVARLAKCPVVTVRAREHMKPAGVIHKVLAAVDFSDLSKPIVMEAKAIAASFGAELLLVHVVEGNFYPIGYTYGAVSMNDILPELETLRGKELNQLNKETGTDLQAECQVLVGKAHHRIVDLAKEHDIDMVVIGTHGHSGLSRLILGSVAERVIRLCECPVYTLKHTEN